MAEQNKNDLLFMQLVMQQQQIGMMSLGKIENPVSKKFETNLDFARMSIDTLDMLIEKTKGNLSDYEDKYLNEVLRELKLNYIEANNNSENKA